MSATSSVLTRSLRMRPRQRRTFIASLFGFTFLASVATVSASALLPCPVTRGRYADSEGAMSMESGKRRAAPAVVEVKKPRRWIEETRPVRARVQDTGSDSSTQSS